MNGTSRISNTALLMSATHILLMRIERDNLDTVGSADIRYACELAEKLASYIHVMNPTLSMPEQEHPCPYFWEEKPF